MYIVYIQEKRATQERKSMAKVVGQGCSTSWPENPCAPLTNPRKTQPNPDNNRAGPAEHQIAWPMPPHQVGFPRASDFQF